MELIILALLVIAVVAIKGLNKTSFEEQLHTKGSKISGNDDMGWSDYYQKYIPVAQINLDAEEAALNGEGHAVKNYATFDYEEYSKT